MVDSFQDKEVDKYLTKAAPVDDAFERGPTAHPLSSQDLFGAEKGGRAGAEIPNTGTLGGVGGDS
jgi:hypothetical protein